MGCGGGEEDMRSQAGAADGATLPASRLISSVFTRTFYLFIFIELPSVHSLSQTVHISECVCISESAFTVGVWLCLCILYCAEVCVCVRKSAFVFFFAFVCVCVSVGFLVIL